MSDFFYESWDSRIVSCKNFLPECSCCKSYKPRIILFPGEYENSKLNKDHLVIKKEDYFGGKLATCTRLCKDSDLKPVDCKSYPFFPYFDKEERIFLKKSISCPLSKEDLKEHKKKTLACWKELAKDKKIANCIKNAEDLGYIFKIE